jgi:predicted nucleotidyltransferase
MEDDSMGQTLELGSTLVDRASIVEVCRRYGVKELSLFGSAARGEMGLDTDIDIMVEFEPEARIGMIKFELFAEELTGLAARKVDLVTKRGLKPWVRTEVLKDLRVIYAA